MRIRVLIFTKRYGSGRFVTLTDELETDSDDYAQLGYQLTDDFQVETPNGFWTDLKAFPIDVPLYEKKI
jgi:hypothetical protein